MDANNNLIIDAGEFVYQGRNAGKSNTGWHAWVDEEILDGVNNDGDGLIDENVGHWAYREVDDVYHERWAEGKASAREPDVDKYEDLIVLNLQAQIKNKGIVIYNGHEYGGVDDKKPLRLESCKGPSRQLLLRQQSNKRREVQPRLCAQDGTINGIRVCVPRETDMKSGLNRRGILEEGCSLLYRLDRHRLCWTI